MVSASSASWYPRLCATMCVTTLARLESFIAACAWGCGVGLCVGVELGWGGVGGSRELIDSAAGAGLGQSD